MVITYGKGVTNVHVIKAKSEVTFEKTGKRWYAVFTVKGQKETFKYPVKYVRSIRGGSNAHAVTKK